MDAALWILPILAPLGCVLACGYRRTPRTVVLIGAAIGPLVWFAPALIFLEGTSWLTPVHLQQAIAVLLALLPLIVAWGLSARWAQRMPEPPRLDQARVQWRPRASHRATWVLLVGLCAVLGLVMGGLWGPLPGLGLGGALGSVLGLAWAWAHRGAAGALRIEARDLVVGQARIPMEDVESVGREVVFLGPIRRERLAIEHRSGSVRLLVTGSPEEDVDVVLSLLCRQLAWAARHAVVRGEALPPPAALELLRQLGGVDQLSRGQVAVGTDGPAS